MISACVPIGKNFGWGVCGLNLARAFTEISSLQHEILTYDTVKPCRPVDKSWPVLNCLSGATFAPFMPEIRGTMNVGYGFIEDMKTAGSCLRTAKKWDHIVCGSTWMREQLEDLGLKNLSVALQGVDGSVFNEHQRCHDWDTFRIFIGGKFEYRKGQDIAIAASKVLLQRHRDVKLVLAVNNPWPYSLLTMSQTKLIRLPALAGAMDGLLAEIMEMNGIAQDRYEYVNVDNRDMASVYGRCNVGLFLSRCEAGNNMVLSEAMATALPAIVNYATGQKDATNLDSALCITDGHAIDNDWIEPNVDAVVYNLEWAYTHRAELYQIGQRGQRYARKLTWEKTARALLAPVNGAAK